MRTLDLTYDYNEDFDRARPRKAKWDADRDSPRLRLDHELLWTKELRSGVLFAPTAPPRRSDGYLLWTDPAGRKQGYASDTITNSYSGWTRRKSRALYDAKAELTTDERSRYLDLGYTIASSTIWPGWVRKDGLTRQTLNTARASLGDRIDLTLECIRLHYAQQSPPKLEKALATYDDFFCLFEGFAEFVEFFHFQDLVTPDAANVRSLLVPDELLGPADFKRPATPTTRDEYVVFREATLNFITARGRRMADWLETHHPDLDVRRRPAS